MTIKSIHTRFFHLLPIYVAKRSSKLFLAFFYQDLGFKLDMDTSVYKSSNWK